MPKFPTLPDGFYRWRDRLLTDPDFQRRAAANPFTRFIARRRARALFNLCAGFIYSQVVSAAVRLGLLEKLAEGPMTLEDLEKSLDLGPDATQRLLESAVALDLAAHRRGGRYGLGELGAALLGNQGIKEMVAHHAMLYSDLSDPVGLLRGERKEAETRLGDFWPYARTEDPAALPPERLADYSQLMAASQGFIADQVLSAYPLSGHRRLLDVGGGKGAFLTAAGKRCPGLELWLFDLPPVAAWGEEALREAGFADRSKTFGGSFMSDSLPEGADVISLVRILHDHDDEVVRALLKKVRAALPDDGRLLVAEPMSDVGGSEAVSAAYFNFYLLAMGTGRPRRRTEIESLLREAGFTRFESPATAMPELVQLLVARP
ncbi:MAG: methyltransferase [Limibacillus sp.]